MDEKINRGKASRQNTPVLNREDEWVSPNGATAGISVNQVIENRYKVLSSLGAGGMGSVFLVEELQTQRRFALKTLLASGATEKAMKRFSLEAKASGLLDHPNLVKCHSFGLINNLQPYFVMDYCQGQTLGRLIEKNLLPERRTIEIFATICNALAYAHSQGVVHRDLKPSNIMIAGPTIKVLDFGIAKVFRDETAFNTLTRTGEIFGSPHYMSPEQCMGYEVDHRADIYSLGCVLFEALTGSQPFVSDTALSVMLRHQSTPPPTLKEATLGHDFSPGLEAIVAKLLAKDPNKRYDNLLVVEEDLRCVLRGEQLSSVPVEPKKKLLSRNVLVVSASALFLIFAVSLIALAPSPKMLKSISTIPSKTPMPQIEALRQINEAKTEFYSDGAGDSYRTFHFPQIAIGQFTPNAGPLSGGVYKSAAGVQKDVQIPIGVSVVHDDPGVLCGFRDDEVSSLLLHGILVDDSAIEHIRNWKNLQKLNINRTDISDQSMATIGKLPKLVCLEASDTRISAIGLRQLPLNRMIALDVGRIPFAYEILPLMNNSKHILSLDLTGTGVRESDLKIINTMTNLENLNLEQNLLTDTALEQLTDLPNLTRLSMSAKNLTPKSINQFKKFKKLGSLVIGGSDWSAADRTACTRAMAKFNCRVLF